MNTGTGGKYEFCSLVPGAYTITEETKSGYISKSPVKIGATLPCTGNLSSQNFTNQKLYCVSGYKLDDCTKTGIAGWRVTINNSTYSTSVNTGTGGKYEFCSLVPGAYTITEETKSGYISKSPVKISATLPCTGNLTDQNFTNQKLYCISGYKLDDCTKTGIAGWRMTINNSTYSTSVNTGTGGKYEFCRLVPGAYTITEETKSGYISKSPVKISATLPCTGNLSNRTSRTRSSTA